MNSVVKTGHWGVRFILGASFVAGLALTTTSDAGTVVRVSTSVGDYSIELLDETAPQTVQNFLNYVNRNDFNGTYLHRVVDGFVAQGGAYRFRLFEGPIDIPIDPPVVNEFNVSNTRGTVAMAKIDGDPDSATNQWFVNLADNTSLDTSNGGFTVFGQVLGEGMEVLDAIDALPFVGLGLKAPNAPYFTELYNNPLDFVYINVEVTERFSSAAHVIESGTGLFITSININDGESYISLNMSLLPSGSDVVLQVNPESVIPRNGSFDGIATYSAEDERLRIPELEVNLDGSVTTVRNVVFVLSNSDPFQFTLESFEL